MDELGLRLPLPLGPKSTRCALLAVEASHDVTVPFGVTMRRIVESKNHALPNASAAMA